MPNPEWMAEAVCTTTDPEIFFPEPRDHKTHQQAITICQQCPVLQQCRQYAKTHQVTYGIWAAQFINHETRSYQIDKTLKPDTSRPHSTKPEHELEPHGTNAGARRHYRRNEKPCHQCLQAARRYKKDNR